MSAAAMLAGAAPEHTPDWHSIEWKKVWRTIRRLQARIVKAVAEGRWNKVKALVYLLTHSGTSLCRRPGPNSYCSGQLAGSRMDSRRGHQSLL